MWHPRQNGSKYRRTNTSPIRLEVEALEDRQLLSATPYLVKDVNPTGDSITRAGGAPQVVFTAVNGTAFFVANDGIHNYELWKTNGIDGGTSLVKDIGSEPIGIGLGPRMPVNVNGTLFFSANSASYGFELWKSDGSSAGTVLVKDIFPGPGWDYLQGGVNFNGSLLFTANDGTHGREIWKSDGTAAGTTLLKDIRTGSLDGATADQLTVVNDTLFFSANDGTSGFELWKSDGTPEGTVLVKDIQPGALGSGTSHLMNVNGTLFFRANDGTSGSELWKSDGTETGTVLVRDIRPGIDGSDQASSGRLDFTKIGTTIFFEANDGTHGRELWKSDGTEAGTVMVKDIRPDSLGSFPWYWANVNGTLFFLAYDGTHGVELWKSDGSESGTVLVKDLNPGSAWGASQIPVNFCGELYFAGNDGTTGFELWKTDGTEAGTELVSDIAPGSGSAIPGNFLNVNGTLFFVANDGIYGNEPWALTGPTSIAGQKLFYNGSTKWNVTNGATFSDDNAIAPDKTAYLPGSGASAFSAVSSYDKGINGLMVDIAGTHGTITASDFIFKVGNNNSPGTWSTATAPTTVTVRSGAGEGGSDRVELLWADGAIQKTWLEVIVKGNDALGGSNTNTGLASSYVFYFGSAIGDSGTGNAGAFQVTSADEISARNNPKGIGNPATRSDGNDFNRDGLVNSADQIIARNNITGLGNQLRFLVVGAGGPFVPESYSMVSNDNLSAPAEPPSSQSGGHEAGASVSVDAGIATALASDYASPSNVGMRVAVLDQTAGGVAPLAPTGAELAAVLPQMFREAQNAIGLVADTNDWAAPLDDELLDTLVFGDVSRPGRRP